MEKVNGWVIYLKIKELTNKGYEQLHINNLVEEVGIKKDMIHEYLIALSTLEFIKFTDHTKEVFMLTELGRQ
jgi:predicted transcriptional regulator